MKKLAIICMILLLSLVSGCSKSYEDSDYISDPFYISSADKPNESNNPTRDSVHLLSSGGYECEINGGEPVIYNGEPVTVPVKVTAKKNCQADMSIGIMCCINGRLQKLSSDSDKDKTMIVKTGIAPEETLEFEVTFTPEVALEDAEKKQLPIMFLGAFNPTFKAAEEYIGYGNTHDIAWIPSKYIELNSKPNTFSENKYGSYNENIVPSDDVRKTDYLQNDSPSSVLKIDKNNTVDFTVYFSNYSKGEYIGYILKNNEVTKINGGQDCIGVTIKGSHSYNIDISVEDIKKGDTIQCFFVKKEGSDFLDLIKFYPILVLSSDFEFEDEPNAPVSSDTASNAPNNTENNQVPEITGASDNISVILPNDSYKDCRHLGYIEGNPRLVVGLSVGLAVYDAETGKLLSSLETTDYEEKDDGYITIDWQGLQVTSNGIYVPKGVFNSRECTFQGVSLYDKELNFIKDIAVIADIFTYDVKSKINIMYDNFPENEAQTIYISEIEDSNIRSRKLCQISEKYKVVKDLLVTDEDFMYGLLKEAADEKSEAYAFAVDLRTGELIINTKKLEYSLGGRSIFPTEKYTVYATGINDIESTVSGTLVYFDKQNRKFKEIQTLNSTECALAGITPDGSKIVTCASVFQGKENPHYQSVRVYSTADGSLIGSLEGSFNSAPLCTDKGLIIYGGGAAKKISFAEMGVS